MRALGTRSIAAVVLLAGAAYGLGENVVQGAVNPDEFLVFKPTLQEGYRPILQRRLGAKEFKLVYDVGGGRMTKNVPVPPEDRARIFEPFQRLDDLMTRKREGTGLGLRITKAQVELHGGRIDLEIEVGRGSKFSIRFPIERVLPAEPASAPLPVAAERA